MLPLEDQLISARQSLLIGKVHQIVKTEIIEKIQVADDSHVVLPIKVYFPFVTCQTHATTSIIEPFFSWLIYFALFQEYTLFFPRYVFSGLLTLS